MGRTWIIIVQYHNLHLPHTATSPTQSHLHISMSSLDTIHHSTQFHITAAPNSASIRTQRVIEPTITLMAVVYTSLTNVEELDAIILSHCNEDTITTLRQALPVHPLLVPGARCWYERILHLVGSNNIPSSQYQCAKTSILPVDYRRLWGVLSNPRKRRSIVKAFQLAPMSCRVLFWEAAPYASVLEMALDAIAVPTGTSTDGLDSVIWPPAAIALVVEWIISILNLEQNADLYDYDIGIEGDGTPPMRDLLSLDTPHPSDIMSWTLATAVSRGCTPLIDGLTQRLGVPLVDRLAQHMAIVAHGNDAIRMPYSHWIASVILTGACYMPEWSDEAPATGSTPAASAIEALWTTYGCTSITKASVDAVIDHVCGTGVVGLTECISSACRDVSLLDSILDTYVRLGVQSKVSIEDMVRRALHSPSRDVDDYVPVARILEWYVEHNGVNRDIQRLSMPGSSTLVSEYYASRIRTKEQSTMFVQHPILQRYLGNGMLYHAAICGDWDKVWITLRDATCSPYHDSVVSHSALALVSCCVTGARITRALGEVTDDGRTHGELVVELLRSDVLKRLLQNIQSFYYWTTMRPILLYNGIEWAVPGRYGPVVINLIYGAAQYLPALAAACDLLDLSAESDGTTYGDRLGKYPAMMEQLLEAVSLDPYADGGAIPWLEQRLARYDGR